MNKQHEFLKSLLAAEESNITELRRSYRYRCDTMAREFSRPEGPAFESSTTETEWRDVRSKLREHVEFAAVLRKAIALGEEGATS